MLNFDFAELEALTAASEECTDALTEIAAEMHGVAIEEVTPAQRQSAKAAAFPYLYLPARAGKSISDLARG